MFWTDTFAVFIHGETSAITDSEREIPEEFALNQNYPNPFNPGTIITYELPIANFVELNIYNLLGQKIAVLISENQIAGFHQVEWDASGYASGIYYYMIKAGDLQAMRKMILLR